MVLETFGRYELLKKLATGGMGQVFLARQKGLGGFQKLLVVKRVLPHLSEEEEFIEMFLDEARIAALLNHPNIAQLFEMGQVDGIYFIAMEYVHGESLRQLVNTAQQKRGGLPVAFKVRIVAEAAAGLDYAHKALSQSGRPLGLIHRDVSPQNVLVGFNGSVKVIDFGVAKAANKISTTTAGAIKGKYPYMSPEQARGEELDHRSDVFGLGIVLYEVLTQTRLFKRDTDTATLRAVVGSKITPPSGVVDGLPKALDTIVLKALARKRDERFQSAGELQIALEEFLVSERLPANAALLSSYMRALYADRLEEEQAASEPTQIHFDIHAARAQREAKPPEPSTPPAPPSKRERRKS